MVAACRAGHRDRREEDRVERELSGRRDELAEVVRDRAVGQRRLPEIAVHEMVDLALHEAPHRPDGGCACRKPAPAMLKRAALEHRLRLSECWMVGDILDDIEAGRRAGCRTVLIDNGNETEWEMTPERVPHFAARDLAQAAAVILDEQRIAA